MNILKTYKASNNLGMAHTYLKANGIKSIILSTGSVSASEKWALWLSHNDGTGDNVDGWLSPYAKRCDAKRDASEMAEWLGLPFLNEKRDGSLVRVS